MGWAATPGPPLKPFPRRQPCFGHPLQQLSPQADSGGPCASTACSWVCTAAVLLEVPAGPGSAPGTGAALCRSKEGASLQGVGRSQEKAVLCPPQTRPPLLPGASPLIRRMCYEGDRWAGKRLSCRNALYRPIEPTCWETNPIIYSPEQQSTLLCRQLGHTGRWRGLPQDTGVPTAVRQPCHSLPSPCGETEAEIWHSRVVLTHPASSAEPK